MSQRARGHWAVRMKGRRMRIIDDEPSRRAFLTTSALTALGTVGLSHWAEAATWTDVEQRNVRITTDFCKAWEQGDPQTLANFLAEDCLVRLSATTPVIVGRQAALDRFTSALSTST